MKKPRKVLLIGIDGFDPNILEKMMAGGQLPHFSRLAQEGFYSRLETVMPPQSPVVWTTIATGQSPDIHGIYDFLTRDPGKYLTKLGILKQGKLGYLPPFQVKTFWDLASEGGIHCTILRWPLTFPARPLHGNLLSGLGTPDMRGTLGRYTLFTTAHWPEPEQKKGRIVRVDVSHDRIQTGITGPVSLSFKGTKDSVAPLTIEINDGYITCRTEDGEFSLKEHSWSDWFKINFKIGFLRRVSGICKFYLQDLGPEFNLYVTPINIANDQSALPISFPLNYAGRLHESIGPYATLGLAEDVNALNDEVINEHAFLTGCDAIMQERERQFAFELARFQEGILACVFDTTDRIQHMFWRFTDVHHPCYDAALAQDFTAVIPGYYRRMDSVVGQALARCDNDTLLMICSDHGFTSFRRAVHLNTWLVQNGFMTMIKGKTAGGELFSDVDWPTTTAFAYGLNSLSLNVKDRECQGEVEPGAVEAVREKLAHRLQYFTDNGQPVIKQVFAPNQSDGRKGVGPLPDLIIGYHREYRSSWQTAVGAAPAGSIIEENRKKWSGDHCCAPDIVPGIFLSNRKGMFHQPQVTNIFSAILSYLSLE